MANRQIPPERKLVYRLGTILIAVGVLSFGSVFLSAALNFGRFDDFEGRVRSMGLRAVGGMALIVVGAGMMIYGTAGAAGSGLTLDPEQARKDVEPWARMRGGVAKDTLDEMGIDLGKVANAIGDRLSSSGETLEERLRGLHRLFNDGILSEEEYLREKKQLLDQE